MMTKSAVAFFTDRAMIPGLHAALLSMAKTNEELNADVFVFANGLTKNDTLLLQKTWSTGNSKRKLFVPQFKPTPLGNTLHGNSTVWGRLFLGELLPTHQKCVYLDCDLLVNASLQPLFDLLTDEVLIAADCWVDREWSLDKDLFVDAGMSLKEKGFNSGVLALNLELWRASGAFEHCLKIAERFAGRFASADQALLNVAFGDRVVGFGMKYNTPLLPYRAPPPAELGENFYHFVGSPKPWDLFGSTLHKSFGLWQSIYLQTAIAGSAWRYLSLQRIVKTSKQVLQAWIRGRKQA